MAGIVPGMSNRTVVFTFLIALAAIWVVNNNVLGIGAFVSGGMGGSNGA